MKAKNCCNERSLHLSWFFAGLALASAVCMKLLEPEFARHEPPFTIIGLELNFKADQLAELFASLQQPTAALLRYHLYFDFVFMAAVYPFIGLMCLRAACRFQGSWKSFFWILASFQLLALLCDVIENACLLLWMKPEHVINGFTLYRIVVVCKWFLALAGFLTALPVLLRRKRIGTA